MRIGITNHAVSRYIERCSPRLEWTEARRELERLAIDAVPLGVRADGADLYHVSDPCMRLAVKRRRGDLVCVTVLAD